MKNRFFKKYDQFAEKKRDYKMLEIKEDSRNKEMMEV
jgi:hypothetical protein